MPYSKLGDFARDIGRTAQNTGHGLSGSGPASAWNPVVVVLVLAWRPWQPNNRAQITGVQRGGFGFIAHGQLSFRWAGIWPGVLAGDQ